MGAMPADGMDGLPECAISLIISELKSTCAACLRRSSASRWAGPNGAGQAWIEVGLTKWGDTNRPFFLPAPFGWANWSLQLEHPGA
ncbi:hypothetical protein THIARS_80171 [Thiomonas delicata]|uniref:Uncharacterized protein n=1 Tax=Thiomonas delicata TaxID=364030 RepID=A0A238D8M2_THIDL|nr:hypothetical protein THIARS_80171 [Thiomonas delicata]